MRRYRKATRQQRARMATRRGQGRYDSSGWVHPVLSTVLYTGGEGGCTAALHKQHASAAARAPYDRSLPQSATVACPARNRYFLFDGSYPRTSRRTGATRDAAVASLTPRAPQTRWCRARCGCTAAARSTD